MNSERIKKEFELGDEAWIIIFDINNLLNVKKGIINYKDKTGIVHLILDEYYINFIGNKINKSCGRVNIDVFKSEIKAWERIKKIILSNLKKQIELIPKIYSNRIKTWAKNGINGVGIEYE